MANDYKFLHDLSDTQLEELLRHTLEEDATDVEFTNYILEIMENREKGKPDSNLSDIHKAWDEFQEKYNGQDSENASLYDFPVDGINEDITKQHGKKRYITIKRILLAAVITCLCASVAASAFEFNIFQAIASWTKDVFSFNYSDVPFPDGAGTQNSRESFKDLQEALDELSVSEVKAPTWLPEGFEQIEVNLLSHLSSKEVEAYYGLNELTICISVTKFDSTYEIQYEKDENSVKETVINGITHYFFTNNDRSVAAWNVNLLECAVHGDITLEEMEQLVNSMY